ncbi:11924_t:CDS:2, partial [Acaulospora morrowiae]
DTKSAKISETSPTLQTGERFSHVKDPLTVFYIYIIALWLMLGLELQSRRRPLCMPIKVLSLPTLPCLSNGKTKVLGCWGAVLSLPTLLTTDNLYACLM